MTMEIVVLEPDPPKDEDVVKLSRNNRLVSRAWRFWTRWSVMVQLWAIAGGAKYRKAVRCLNRNHHVESFSTRTQKGMQAITDVYKAHSYRYSLWTRNCSSTYKADAKSAVSCAATTFSSTWSSMMLLRSQHQHKSILSVLSYVTDHYDGPPITDTISLLARLFEETA